MTLEKEVMRTYHHVWENALSPQQCQEIIDYAAKIPFLEAGVRYQSSKAPAVRKSNIKWLPRDDQEGKWIWEHIIRMFHQSNQANYGFNLSYMPSIQYTEYHSDQQGYYDWHIDTVWTDERPSHRKLSVSIQLSDSSDYEGGQLEFERKPEKDIRKRGTAVIFPSFVRHRVTPVTAGKRHSLVAWFEGPKFV
ncbi:MAG: 2OG-Fe(II) oxygenase [Alphaproteobacteria bacterium]